jgi:hypothetical protein
MANICVRSYKVNPILNLQHLNFDFSDAHK